MKRLGAGRERRCRGPRSLVAPRPDLGRVQRPSGGDRSWRETARVVTRVGGRRRDVAQRPPRRTGRLETRARRGELPPQLRILRRHCRDVRRHLRFGASRVLPNLLGRLRAGRGDLVAAGGGRRHLVKNGRNIRLVAVVRRAKRKSSRPRYGFGGLGRLRAGARRPGTSGTSCCSSVFPGRRRRASGRNEGGMAQPHSGWRTPCSPLVTHDPRETRRRRSGCPGVGGSRSCNQGRLGTRRSDRHSGAALLTARRRAKAPGKTRSLHSHSS